MKIAGYLRTSLIEWPGKISSVIFVSGCNFRCPFCHNADLVDPKKIKKLPKISEEKVLIDLKKRKKWIDGVVVTGGELCLRPDLPNFLNKLKKLGFETMIQTNGSRPEMISLIVKRKQLIVDYLALDFKAPLDKRYAKAVGLKKFDPKIWIKSLRVILNSGIPFELRTTVVPGIHDEIVLLAMARQLKKLVMPASRDSFGMRHSQLRNWFIQNFQPQNCLDPKFEKIKPFSKIELENLLKAIRKIIPKAKLRIP